ncbi:CAAX prenyl protease 1 homolog [Neodiprion lecontei]|uniref:CAAX prenyl protease n=1 Tax=Neodiprion lecontei TaxID=441921 RepID=A0A6J0C1C8_NEOLC|nr:CAAX prenyl protease 1 homolog [Neodiprion lecontei]
MSSSIEQFVGENLRCELLALIWILWSWKFYLSLRQTKLMNKLVDVPGELKDLITPEVYNKARLYAIDCNYFSNIKSLFSTFVTTGMILFFAFRHFWDWAVKISTACGISKHNEILIGGTCMLIMNILSTIVDLPFSVYNTFWLENKHGFNKQTVSFYIKDQIKKFIVLQIIVIPLKCGVVWIVQIGGDYFFVYLWVFTGIVTLFMLIIYPEVIAPLFDKYSPLPEGELRTKIEELASSLGFPLYKLYIVEGSKRSSHSNAYLYGFHKHKRIVLFDTLVKEYYKPDANDTDKDKGCETDEVVAVLAHELGHWKLNHTFKCLVLSQVNILLIFIIFAKLLNYQPMYTAFGFSDSQPIFIGLIIVMMYILIPLNTLMGFVSVVISRKFEFQADNFAKTLGHTVPLKSALVKLHKDNLGFPVFDKLYSGWHHSHPPLLERLEALDDKKSN